MTRYTIGLRAPSLGSWFRVSVLCSGCRVPVQGFGPWVYFFRVPSFGFRISCFGLHLGVRGSGFCTSGSRTFIIIIINTYVYIYIYIYIYKYIYLYIYLYLYISIYLYIYIYNAESNRIDQHSSSVFQISGSGAHPG